MYFELFYPERRTVDANTLIGWAKDVMANDPLFDGADPSGVWDAIAILDPDYITLGNHGNPIQVGGEDRR